MMTKDKYSGPIIVPQFPISTDGFDDIAFEENGSQINVIAVYRPGCFGFGQFYFDVEFCGFECTIPSLRSPDLKFGIPADCTVTIFLKDPKIWRWSNEFYAVTLKEEINLYRKYKYNKETQVVSFKAKKRDGNEVDDFFTMNVEIFQKRSTKQWLPISIDPWVENPRPNN